MAVGSPGLLDPCEKDPFDTLATMTDQQREDITSSAQVSVFLCNPKALLGHCPRVLFLYGCPLEEIMYSIHFSAALISKSLKGIVI